MNQRQEAKFEYALNNSTDELLEQWGLPTGPQKVTPSRAGTAAYKNAEQAKAQATQQELEKFRLGNEELFYSLNTWT